MPRALLDINLGQKQDLFCQRVYPLALSRKHGFLLENHLIYKQRFDGTNAQKLLVLPRKLLFTTLQALHDDPMSGHLGRERTYQRMRARYYLPGMFQLVDKYVSSCKRVEQRSIPVGCHTDCCNRFPSEKLLAGLPSTMLGHYRQQFAAMRILQSRQSIPPVM